MQWCHLLDLIVSFSYEFVRLPLQECLFLMSRSGCDLSGVLLFVVFTVIVSKGALNSSCCLALGSVLKVALKVLKQCQSVVFFWLIAVRWICHIQHCSKMSLEARALFYFDFLLCVPQVSSEVCAWPVRDGF